MEKNRPLNTFQEGKLIPMLTSNKDPLSIGNFAVIKKNKLILVPFFLGLIIEIPLDLILIPVIVEIQQLYYMHSFLILTVLKMMTIQLLISIWVLKILQNTITKTNNNPPDVQNLPEFDSIFQSLRKSLIYVPKILLINFLFIIFVLGFYLITNNSRPFYYPKGEIIQLTPFMRFLDIIIPIFIIVILIYIIILYVHWIILTVYNEDRLKQSFLDSLRYVRRNFKKILNIILIPIFISIGVGIIVLVINIDWLYSVILNVLRYFVIFYVSLVFGGNYLKYNT